MPKHINGNRAWALLAAFILYYEIRCNEGELLSQAVDRWLDRHPILTRTIIVQTALHLMNVYDIAPPVVRHLDMFGVINLARRAVLR